MKRLCALSHTRDAYTVIDKCSTEPNRGLSSQEILGSGFGKYFVDRQAIVEIRLFSVLLSIC